MKTLQNTLNESLCQSHEDNNINESIVLNTLTLIILFVAQTLQIAMISYTPNHDEITLMDRIKSWLKDKKANKIAKNLVKDQDIINFLNQPNRKQQTGWRDLLKTKLSKEEFEYIYRLTKSLVKSKME